MSEADQKICFINPPIRPDKNLVYKETKYPIEFNTLKKYSNYFYNNRKSYKNIENIEIKEILDVKKDDFQNFVSCCQNQKFIISDSNVFSLYQLSVQYEVPLLIQKTEEYIKENNKTLVFESIFIKIRKQNENDENDHLIDLETDEKFISSNIFEFINNDQMYLLPIPVLYRILSRSFANAEMSNDHLTKSLSFCLNAWIKEKEKLRFSSLFLISSKQTTKFLVV